VHEVPCMLDVDLHLNQHMLLQDRQQHFQPVKPSKFFAKIDNPTGLYVDPSTTVHR